MTLNLLSLFLSQTPRNFTDYQRGSEAESAASGAKQPKF